MRCPDCGLSLSEVRIDSRHFLYRCGRCGGVLSDSDTVNNVTAGHLRGWRRIGLDPRWLVGGNDKCPVCSTRIRRYSDEEVPFDLPVKRCGRCGKWWFPGDSFFRFKEAQEVKVNYFRIWFGTPKVPKLLLPVVVTAMVVAMGIGVGMVRETQRMMVAADAGVSAFSVAQLDRGRALVTFVAAFPPGLVEYRQGREARWSKVVPVAVGEGIYRVELENVVAGEWVEVKIGDKVYEFEVK